MNTQNKEDGKILFVISTYWQYENYIKTNALEEIKDRVNFLVYPKLADLDFGIPKDRISLYSYPEKKDILHRHIFNMNSWRLRKRDIVFWLRSLLFKPNQRRAYRILAMPVVYNIVKAVFLKRAEDPKLTALIQKINPAVVLLPSHAFEGRTFEIIRIAKKMKILSLMIIDNWDTLANKTIFTEKPDYLGVWSRQHIEHAVNVKGMPRERIFVLGVPRFKTYIKPETKNWPSPYPFRYALFVGIAEFFNELGALKKIDELIEKHGSDIKVVYRPNITQHTRNCPDVFFEYDFKHIVLDTPAKAYYKRSSTWDISKDSFNKIYYPDPNYYPKLLSNMEFMISPQTTMILEAALLGKKNYILAYDDGCHRFGPKFIFDNCIFLNGIECLPNVRMVRTFEDMEKIFISGDWMKQQAEPVDVDYFVSKEATADYPANLKKIISQILTNPKD